MAWDLRHPGFLAWFTQNEGDNEVNCIERCVQDVETLQDPVERIALDRTEDS